MEHSIFNKSNLDIRKLLGLLTLAGAICLWTWPLLPTSDSPTYFHFADTRPILNIPNSLDVLSNLFFLFFGIFGLKIALRAKNKKPNNLTLYIVLISVSAILTCFGSIYFHISPSPSTLLWDRLPMTLAFMSILAMIISDRTSKKVGLYSLVFLIPFGLLSVIGFQFGWLTLKPYIAVQYGSILFIVLAISIWTENKISNTAIWSSIGLYAVAKAFEISDAFVFNITGLISGHTLKHFFSSLAIYKLLTINREARK